jgi:hypothetical protein
VKKMLRTFISPHPNIALVVDPDHQINDAQKLLKPDSEEYFRVASHQITVYPLEGSGRTYADILSAEGMKLFQQAQQRYDRNDIKDTAARYSIRRERSGSWFKPDKSHFKWVNYQDEGEINGMFNTWSNLTILGEMENMKCVMTTSSCVFITDEWCLTKSGSIYKLGTKTLE